MVLIFLDLKEGFLLEPINYHGGSLYTVPAECVCEGKNNP